MNQSRWLTSDHAPEGSRKPGKRIARPAVLDPGVKQDRQARQIGKPELGAYVDCAEWQHARRQCGNAQPGHDGRSDRRNAAADENLCPGHACSIEKLPGHRSHAAGLGHRGKRQGLVRAMLPAWRCEPAKLFFGKKFPVAAPGMQADDHRVEFPPVVALKQIARRSDPDFDQQLRILRIHSCDQRREFRSRHMVADADGEALPGCGKDGERATVYLQELAGVVEKGCALRRKLHAPGRPLDEPAVESLFKPFQLQADCGLRRPHGFSREREAAKLDDADESLDGIQVEGAFCHFQMLSLI